jgi:hypothetical protein
MIDDRIIATAMRTHLGLVRAAQQAAARRRPTSRRGCATSPTRRMYLLDVGATLPSDLARRRVGGHAELVNAVWGTSYTAATIRRGARDRPADAVARVAIPSGGHGRARPTRGAHVAR